MKQELLSGLNHCCCQNQNPLSFQLPEMVLVMACTEMSPPKEAGKGNHWFSSWLKPGEDAGIETGWGRIVLVKGAGTGNRQENQQSFCQSLEGKAGNEEGGTRLPGSSCHLQSLLGWWKIDETKPETCPSTMALALGKRAAQFNRTAPKMTGKQWIFMQNCSHCLRSHQMSVISV